MFLRGPEFLATPQGSWTGLTLGLGQLVRKGRPPPPASQLFTWISDRDESRVEEGCCLRVSTRKVRPCSLQSLLKGQQEQPFTDPPEQLKPAASSHYSR